MHESEQEHELAAWEARLGAFRPGSSRLDRDRVMFLAGRASAQAERAHRAGPSVGWVWPAALATIAGVAGGLLVALVMQQRGAPSPPAMGASGPVAREQPRPTVQDRDEAPGGGDNRETFPVEPTPVLWPGAAEGGMLTVRPPRMDDADRTFAKIADGRFVGSGLETASPPGSFGSPVAPGDPRRPRSYVEHRRMLLEELECFPKTSGKGPFRHQPTGARSMKSPARTLSLLLATLAVLGAVSSPAGHACGGEEEPVRIILHPAPATRPVLKHQLLPTLYERRPGNAVVFYGRVKAEKTGFFTNKEIWDNIYRALEAPLEELRDMEHILLPRDDSIFRDLERGGQCEDSDWQYPAEEDGFSTLLPDAQQQREFARLLVADARGRIARGDFDGALRTLKAGYAMARHTADNPFIVTGLVGAVIGDMMSDCVLELIQQPGAPNLYWPLTYLPDPFFDTRRIFEGEMLAMGYAFPALRNANHSVSDPEYWRRQIEETGKLHAMYDPEGRPGEKAPSESEIAARLLRGYPLAKQALIEQGMTPEEVEAMAEGQVVLLQASRRFDELRDEMLKCILLPYWQAQPHLNALEERIIQTRRRWEEAIPLCEAYFPAVQAGRTAFARLDRQIAMLRLFEALRLYGASHEGRLPERLDDVGVPVPIDPITGKPFAYRLDGDVAHVEGPSLPGRPCRYEVRLVSEEAR